MKGVTFFSLLACGAATAHVGEHPIKRVIGLVQELAEKAKAEGIAEADTYEQYTHWCGKTTGKLKEAIAKETKMIASMQSKVDARESEKLVLGREIESLTAELAANEKAAQEAKTARDEAKALYESTFKDFEDTVAALGQAIKGLEGSENPDGVGLVSVKKAAAMLLQRPRALERMTSQQQEVLTQMAEMQSPLSGKGPAARKYDFKSSNIITMLKRMKAEFEDQQQGLKMAEMSAANEYQQLKGVSDESHTVATESKEKKTGIKAEVEGILSQLSSDLTNTKEDLAADSKSSQDTKMSCKIKAEEFKQRTYMRKQEQEALAYGIKILEKVAGVRSSVPAGKSFLQLKDRGYNDRKKAVDLIRKKADSLHSKALRLIAKEAGKRLNTPGVAVELNMTIQKQIWALKDEQLAEDKKKFWCDTEINKTTMGIDKKADDMNTLKDDKQVAAATVDELTSAINTAAQAVNDLKEQMHEATLVRQQEKNENSLAIEDAKDAQAALKNAISELEKYYKDAQQLADSAALVQIKAKAPAEVSGAPASWDQSSFTGSGETSLIAMLEETNADFGKMEVETEAKETSESSEFAKDMKDSEADMGRRNTEIELKTQERTRLMEKMVEWEKTYKLTDRERELLIQYNKDLDKECNGKEGGSYEDRKEARAEEMESLETAKSVLGAAFSFSQLGMRKATPKAFLQPSA